MGRQLRVDQVRGAGRRLRVVANVSIAINIPSIRSRAAVFDDGAAAPVSGSVCSSG